MTLIWCINIYSIILNFHFIIFLFQGEIMHLEILGVGEVLCLIAFVYYEFLKLKFFLF